MESQVQLPVKGCFLQLLVSHHHAKQGTKLNANKITKVKNQFQHTSPLCLRLLHWIIWHPPLQLWQLFSLVECCDHATLRSQSPENRPALCLALAVTVKTTLQGGGGGGGCKGWWRIALTAKSQLLLPAPEYDSKKPEKIEKLLEG